MDKEEGNVSINCEDYTEESEDETSDGEESEDIEESDEEYEVNAFPDPENMEELRARAQMMIEHHRIFNMEDVNRMREIFEELMAEESEEVEGEHEVGRMLEESREKIESFMELMEYENDSE